MGHLPVSGNVYLETPQRICQHPAVFVIDCPVREEMSFLVHNVEQVLIDNYTVLGKIILQFEQAVPSHPFQDVKLGITAVTVYVYSDRPRYTRAFGGSSGGKRERLIPHLPVYPVHFAVIVDVCSFQLHGVELLVHHLFHYIDVILGKVSAFVHVILRLVVHDVCQEGDVL